MRAVDAIILAGGMGTRLRGAVPDIPKALAPVGGRPFLRILLDSLVRHPEIGRVILALGYQADRVIREFRGTTGYPFRILFSVEEAPLGTGGAIRKALSQAKGETVLAMNGDTFVDVDFGKLIDDHERHGLPVTLVACRAESAGRFGTVMIDARGAVASFHEKAPGGGSGIVNAGVYVIERRLFDGIEEGRVLSLERDLLPQWIAGGIHVHRVDGKFIDIGVPESYREAQDYLKEYLK